MGLFGKWKPDLDKIAGGLGAASSFSQGDYLGGALGLMGGGGMNPMQGLLGSLLGKGKKPGDDISVTRGGQLPQGPIGGMQRGMLDPDMLRRLIMRGRF